MDGYYNIIHSNYKVNGLMCNNPCTKFLKYIMTKGEKCSITKMSVIKTSKRIYATI